LRNRVGKTLSKRQKKAFFCTQNKNLCKESAFCRKIFGKNGKLFLTLHPESQSVRFSPPEKEKNQFTLFINKKQLNYV